NRHLLAIARFTVNCLKGYPLRQFGFQRVRLTPICGVKKNAVRHLSKEHFMRFSNSARLAFGAAAILSALAYAPVSAQSVAVTSIVEHPALDSIKDGVEQALKEAGYTQAKGLEWQFQTAQGNTAIAAQIARKFVG